MRELDEDLEVESCRVIEAQVAQELQIMMGEHMSEIHTSLLMTGNTRIGDMINSAHSHYITIF